MRKKSRLSWFILAVFMMTIAFGGVMPNAVSAANLTDVQGHWAAAQINAMVDQGIVAGYPNNTFKPNANITRAEFIVLSNKSFAFSNTAEINYSDVKSSDWFANDIAKAKAAGYISGYEDGTMKPNNNISRQEAAVIVANILKLNSAGSDELKKFKDASSIPAWSASSVAALVKGGILAGYPDGTFQPKKAITRAEAVVILTKAKGTTTPSKPEPGIDLSKISKAGTYGPATGNQAISGDVTISASGVTLQNATVSGDLTITDAVGNGDVTLKNVTVKGTAYIKGGGANSVHLNNCVLGKVVINKADGKLRVVLEGSTSISQLVADSAVTVAGKGTITKAVINKAGVVIETEPGSITFGATGITALINNKTVSAPSSGGGGGGGGTGGGGAFTITPGIASTQDFFGATMVTVPFTVSDAGVTKDMITVTLNDADATKIPWLSGTSGSFTFSGVTKTAATSLTGGTITVNKPGTTAVTKNFTIGSGPVVITITPGTASTQDFFGATMVTVPFTVSDAGVTKDMITVTLNDADATKIPWLSGTSGSFTFSGVTKTAATSLTGGTITVSKPGTTTVTKSFTISASGNTGSHIVLAVNPTSVNVTEGKTSSVTVTASKDGIAVAGVDFSAAVTDGTKCSATIDDSTGILTITGIAAGNTTITVTGSKIGETIDPVSISVTVNQAPVGITITAQGQPLKVPTGAPVNMTIVSVSFTVSDPAVTSNMITVVINDGTKLNYESGNFTFSNLTSTVPAGINSATVKVSKPGLDPVEQQIPIP